MPLLSSMEITQRMRAIINLVEDMDVVADIGCDHGFVSATLIEEKRAKHVLACDISRKSLEKAIKLIKKHDLPQITTIVSDGLLALKGSEVDCVIIAGMGGLMIQKILQEGLEGLRGRKKLVLAPQGNEYELRTWLDKNGYFIQNEAIAKDGEHYYQIIAAQVGSSERREDIYLHFGYYPVERREELQRAFLECKRKEYEKIISSAKGGKNTQDYIAEKEHVREQIVEVLKCLSH